MNINSDILLVPIKIHPLFIEDASIFLKDQHELNALYLTLTNIEKYSIVSFNIKDQLEVRRYFSKYLYNINEVLLSFNFILLKKYIIKKSTEECSKLEFLVNKGNKQNKITYLLSQLFSNNNTDLYYLELIHRFYLYENLFRHQLCHGWINVFPYIFDTKNTLNLKISNIYFDQKDLADDYDFSVNSLSLDQIRLNLKKDYYFEEVNPDQEFLFEEVSPKLLNNKK